MLVIKPIQEKSEQKKICGECGVEYIPDALAYKATEDETELLGICQFKVSEPYAYIYSLQNKLGIDDLEALIITGRAALNFIDLAGVQNVIILTENRNLHKILGFKPDEDNVMKINLDGYFISPCKKQ